MIILYFNTKIYWKKNFLGTEIILLLIMISINTKIEKFEDEKAAFEDDLCDDLKIQKNLMHVNHNFTFYIQIE